MANEMTTTLIQNAEEALDMATIKDIIQIVKKGITSIPADCVVNAANSGLWEGGGVCGAIFRAAGSAELTRACERIGHCDTGKAVITPAFKLDARYIIHAVGPVYRDGKHGEPEHLYDAYKNSLMLAVEYDCHSIVFPVISSGIYGYPQEEAWKKAIQACVDFLGKNSDYDIVIRFAVLNEGMAALGEKTIKQVFSEMTDSDKVTSRSKLVVPSGSAEKAAVASKSAIEKPSNKPSTREERVEIFNDTLFWIDNNTYLSDAVAASKKKTTVFDEDDYPVFDSSAVQDTEITVTGSRSFEAAMRLSVENPDARIAVMNFANAFHPGGGVARGASAQEECLCRCSTLYPLLNRRFLKKAYYDVHKDRNTPKASDALIYIEDVVICKTDDAHPKRMSQTDWVPVDVITIAAPDLRTKSNKYFNLVDNGTFMNDAELYATHLKRAVHMLTCAASKKADILVLGAFGCGAFENNPEIVAKAYKQALELFPKVFKKVEFAVYTSAFDKRNYTVFKDILG